MAKYQRDAILDAALELIKSNVTREIACSAQPTTFTEANVTYALADVTLSSTDMTVADGDTSGRKLTVAAKSANLIDASGTATHIALVDVDDSILYYVTTCASQALVANGSNMVSFPAWDIEIRDAA